MTERISLVEAYDNRDVIAQLVRLRDNVDELLNILKDIDPNGDLTNVVTKTGDQTIDGVKTFIGQIVADCDIIQNGAAYETHAEQVFSVNDYIVTRDGQITGLAAGDLSGFHVKKYNGVDDSRLGVDNTGTMRVGDVGFEQPLATRDEAADMVSGAYVRWDGVNQKLIAPDVDVGDDTHPVKFVDGAPVAVTGELQTKIDLITITNTSTLKIYRYGPFVLVSFNNHTAYISTTTIKSDMPTAACTGFTLAASNNVENGNVYILEGTTNLIIRNVNGTPFYATFVYVTSDP